jgi:sec-independent protein translocase protein TatC
MALVPFPGPQQLTAYSTAPAEDPDESNQPGNRTPSTAPTPPEDPAPEPEFDESQAAAEGQMSFLEHLEELRKRILRSCIAIALGVVATFWFIQPIFDFILTPTRSVLPEGVKMIYTQPGEAFSLYVTVALIAGITVAAPFIMYQVWMFIAPGLYAHLKKLAYPFVGLTTLGFILGAAFNHYVAFGVMMAFFASFNSAELAFLPRLQDVFGLYTRMLLVLGLVFQLPTIVFFLAKMKLVTGRFLLVNLKYAVLVIFIASAIITPGGDMWGQIIIAVPMLGLYLVSILIAWVVNPRQKRTS